MIEKEITLSKAPIKVLIDFISETAGNKGKFSAARGHKKYYEISLLHGFALLERRGFLRKKLCASFLPGPMPACPMKFST